MLKSVEELTGITVRIGRKMRGRTEEKKTLGSFTAFEIILDFEGFPRTAARWAFAVWLCYAYANRG